MFRGNGAHIVFPGPFAIDQILAHPTYKMLKIRQMIQQGVDTATDIYNTAMRDDRLRTDLMTFEEMEGISLNLPNPSLLDEFRLEITPLHGYYANKRFVFQVNVPDSFPFHPYKIQLLSNIFHPNIDPQGRVCLNILREDWTPSIDLSQVACSLQYLLTEPNAEDPLNEEAAECLLQSPGLFLQRIEDTYCEDPSHR